MMMVLTQRLLGHVASGVQGSWLRGVPCLELVRVACDHDVGVETPLHHCKAVLVAPGHHLAPAYQIALFLTAVCSRVI